MNCLLKVIEVCIYWQGSILKIGPVSCKMLSPGDPLCQLPALKFQPMHFWDYLYWLLMPLLAIILITAIEGSYIKLPVTLTPLCTTPLIWRALTPVLLLCLSCIGSSESPTCLKLRQDRSQHPCPFTWTPITVLASQTNELLACVSSGCRC